MRVKTTIDNGKVKYEYIRDSWKEYFMVEIDWGFRDVILPKGFIHTGGYIDRAIDIYWLFPFVPFILLKNKIVRSWWETARWFWRNGYINVEERRPIYWFWPYNITFKKVSKVDTNDKLIK